MISYQNEKIRYYKQLQTKMQKHGRKLSDYTTNSPNNIKNDFGVLRFNEKGQLNMSGKTQKSKYSNSSKLTKSQLFNAISKGSSRRDDMQILKQREIQVQILSNSLEAIQNSEITLMLQIGNIFNEYSDLAKRLQNQLQVLASE